MTITTDKALNAYISALEENDGCPEDAINCAAYALIKGEGYSIEEHFGAVTRAVMVAALMNGLIAAADIEEIYGYDAAVLTASQVYDLYGWGLDERKSAPVAHINDGTCELFASEFCGGFVCEIDGATAENAGVISIATNDTIAEAVYSACVVA